MSPEDQNIAIAAAVGWRPTTDAGICWGPNGEEIITPPSYTSDLNAIAVAEKNRLLNDIGLRNEYVAALKAMDRPTPEFFLITASSEERAEAFLRALNLWEEAS